MDKKTWMGIIAFLCLSISSHGECAEEASFSLDEVIVTATKTPLSVAMVPTDVSIITADEITARNAHTLKDIIDSLPGVAINRSGGRRALSIRGFYSRYSMILIDGQRIPAEPDANYELERLSLNNVERIEVVRGSASAIYGADALGGVINLISKKGKQREISLEVDGVLQGSSGDSEKTFAVRYDSGSLGKTNVVLTADHSKNNVFLKENGTSFYPFGTRSHIDVKVDYHPTATETLSLGSSYLEESTHEYGMMSGMMGATLSTNLHDDNRRQRYNLSYQSKQNNKDTYITMFHSSWEKNNDTLNRANGQYTNAIYGYTTISGIEARTTHKVNPQHKVTVGGEYRPELFKGTGIESGKGLFSTVLKGKTYSGSEVKTDYRALYLQDEWLMSQQWLMVSSLRWDGSNRFDSNLSPKLGLTYAPKADLRYKLNVGTGFRVPSPNQLYLNLNIIRNSRLVNLLGNSSLHPEKSIFYDVSIEKDWGSTTGKITFFSSNVKDMIDEVWVASNQIQYQNIGRAKLQGIEASIHRPINKTLSWNANYTYLDAVNSITHEQLFNRARHKLSSQWTYQPALNWKANIWLDAYIGYRHQPSAYITNNKTYVTWNMSLEKELSKNQSLVVGIENIFNHKDEALCIPGTLFQIGYKVNL